MAVASANPIFEAFLSSPFLGSLSDIGREPFKVHLGTQMPFFLNAWACLSEHRKA